MPEVIVKYKSAKELKALKDLAKILDIIIETPENPTVKKHKGYPPITFSKNPDFKALAGIWEGKNITIEELRKEAWGDRI